MSKIRDKVPELKPSSRLKNLNDLRRYLATLIHETRAGKINPGLAGRLTYMLNVLAGFIKDGDLEGRMAALEEKLLKANNVDPLE